MSRCSYCDRFIWPWQRRGWLMLVGRGPMRFHTVCWLAMRRSTRLRLLEDAV